MANRDFFSSAMALLLPFCGYLAYAGNRNWRIVSGVAVGLGVYAIIIGRTRSTWLALAAGLAISNLCVILLRHRLGTSLVRGWFKSMALLMLGTVVAGILALVIPNRQGAGADIKARALSLVQLSDDRIGSGNYRLKIWQQALRMIADHPIFGVGSGNYRICIQHYGFYEKLTLPSKETIVVPTMFIMFTWKRPWKTESQDSRFMLESGWSLCSWPLESRLTLTEMTAASWASSQWR